MATKKSKTANKKSFDKETYMEWFRSMTLMRRFEEKAGQLYGQQKISGFCHLYIGQEACVAGAVSALKKGDKYITAYRDHAHPIGLGTDPKAVMAELFGKETGVSKGKGGSMHMFDKEKRAADAAVRQGAFHEALNMAMSMKLPVIFAIENNGYAMGTSVKRTSNVTELHTLGEAYDMPSKGVDAMNVENVHNAVAEAAERARKGDGPTLLEFRTYRYKGHSMSDPAKYRTKEELEEYKGKDPIEQAREAILKNKYATEDELKEIDNEAKEQVKECVKFAEESDFPHVDEVYRDVYAQEDYPFIVD